MHTCFCICRWQRVTGISLGRPGNGNKVGIQAAQHLLQLRLRNEVLGHMHIWWPPHLQQAMHVNHDCIESTAHPASMGWPCLIQMLVPYTAQLGLGTHVIPIPVKARLSRSNLPSKPY